jgi:hypothetical protein
MSNFHHFCTYFDYRYLPRALALYWSLYEHGHNFLLWALCFDGRTYEHLKKLNLPNLRPISIDEFLSDDKQLAAARENRSLVEFYFTCSPSLPLYVFKSDPSVDQVTYIDADLFFFQDPEPLFNEISSYSIAIIAHRFPPRLQHFEAMGVYNVGWITFRRDPEGLACLTRWRNQCLEWCFDRVEGSRYADQGYLNDWPEKYKNLVILQHKGANLAPWNLKNYNLHLHDQSVWVDEDPLIFFHFQSLAHVSSSTYKLNFRKYQIRPSKFVKKNIYKPYLKELENIFHSQNIINTDERMRSPNDVRLFPFIQKGVSIPSNIKTNLFLIEDLFIGDYIFPRDYIDD